MEYKKSFIICWKRFLFLMKISFLLSFMYTFRFAFWYLFFSSLFSTRVLYVWILQLNLCSGGNGKIKMSIFLLVFFTINFNPLNIKFNENSIKNVLQKGYSFSVYIMEKKSSVRLAGLSPWVQDRDIVCCFKNE